MTRSRRTPLRAVTFDCWQTLLRDRHFERARALRAEALVEVASGRGVALAAEAAAEVIHAAHAHHVELWTRGVGSGSREIAGWALGIAGIEDPALTETLGHRFEEAGLAGDVEALAGAGETLAELARRDIRIALVCDTGFSGGRVVRRFLARVGLLDALEVQVFSDEVGVPKPHRRMFEAALRPLGVAPGEAVHVGDLRPTDVAGGRGFGMGTVRLRAAHDDRSEHPEADAVADSHAQLLELLRDRLP